VGSGTRPRLEPRPARRRSGGAPRPAMPSGDSSSGRAPASSSNPMSRCRPESTARQRCCSRPCGFASSPGYLRVRIAPKHPGASPSALEPDSPLPDPVGAGAVRARPHARKRRRGTPLTDHPVRVRPPRSGPVWMIAWPTPSTPRLAAAPPSRGSSNRTHDQSVAPVARRVRVHRGHGFASVAACSSWEATIASHIRTMAKRHARSRSPAS